MLQKVQVGLLAVIAAALLALVAGPDQPESVSPAAVTVAPCIVVVTPTDKGLYRNSRPQPDC